MQPVEPAQIQQPVRLPRPRRRNRRRSPASAGIAIGHAPPPCPSIAPRRITTTKRWSVASRRQRQRTAPGRGRNRTGQPQQRGASGIHGIIAVETPEKPASAPRFAPRAGALDRRQRRRPQHRSQAASAIAPGSRLLFRPPRRRYRPNRPAASSPPARPSRHALSGQPFGCTARRHNGCPSSASDPGLGPLVRRHVERAQHGDQELRRAAQLGLRLPRRAARSARATPRPDHHPYRAAQPRSAAPPPPAAGPRRNGRSVAPPDGGRSPDGRPRNSSAATPPASPGGNVAHQHSRLAHAQTAGSGTRADRPSGRPTSRSGIRRTRHIGLRVAGGGTDVCSSMHSRARFSFSPRWLRCPALLSGPTDRHSRGTAASPDAASPPAACPGSVRSLRPYRLLHERPDQRRRTRPAVSRP